MGMTLSDNRKFFSRVVILAWVIIAFFTVPFAHGGEKSYTLVCRGGGAMEGDYLNSSFEHSFSISFKKSAYPASERQPQQGECAWIDRPLKEDEPGTLYLPSLSREVRINLKFSATGVRIDDRMARGITGPPPQRQNLKYLIDGITGGSIFYVRVHKVKTREGAGYLQVDQVGP